MDMSEAFDCAEPTILLYKLESADIRGTSLRLLQSYLMDRRLTVCVNGHTLVYLLPLVLHRKAVCTLVKKNIRSVFGCNLNESDTSHVGIFLTLFGKLQIANVIHWKMCHFLWYFS